MDEETTAWGSRGLGYDAAFDAVADLAGDFDAQSPSDTERWVRDQWTSVADALGWRAHLDRAGDGDDAALDAFAEWLTERQRKHPRIRPLPEALQAERARVQQQSLEVLEGLADETHNLWRTDALSQVLPDSGCFGDHLRAFRADVAPSYFGNRHPTRPEGCVYPVLVSLGTFPFVYGGVLGPEPPGLRWRVHGAWTPARHAMRITSSFWRVPGNLRQDARAVATQFEHFRSTIVRVVEKETLRKARRARPVEATQTANGPRGLVTERAISYVHARFAAFFAARRAYLRGRLGASVTTRRRDWLEELTSP